MRLLNSTSETQIFSAKGVVVLPNEAERVVYEEEIILLPNETLEVPIEGAIPNNAPLGDYIFKTDKGLLPEEVWDSDSFNFTVESRTKVKAIPLGD